MVLLAGPVYLGKHRDPGAVNLELKISTTNTIAGSSIELFACIPVDLNPEVQQIISFATQ
jgi:hypothetical protein